MKKLNNVFQDHVTQCTASGRFGDCSEFLLGDWCLSG